MKNPQQWELQKTLNTLRQLTKIQTPADAKCCGVRELKADSNLLQLMCLHRSACLWDSERSDPPGPELDGWKVAEILEETKEEKVRPGPKDFLKLACQSNYSI